MRHCANLAKSRRLQNLLEALRDGRPHTTKDLQDLTGGVAIGSAVSELRAHAYDIDCRFVRKTETGAKVFEYRLLGGTA